MLRARRVEGARLWNAPRLALYVAMRGTFVQPSNRGLARGSQQDLERRAKRRESASKLCGQCEQGRWLGAGTTKPSAQRFVRHLVSLAAAQAKRVDDTAFGRIETNRGLGIELERFTSKLECLRVEGVPTCARTCRGYARTSRQCDIRHSVDVVRQLVSDQRRAETQGGLGRTLGDLKQLFIKSFVSTFVPASQTPGMGRKCLKPTAISPKARLICVAPESSAGRHYPSSLMSPTACPRVFATTAAVSRAPQDLPAQTWRFPSSREATSGTAISCADFSTPSIADILGAQRRVAPHERLRPRVRGCLWHYAFRFKARRCRSLRKCFRRGDPWRT